MPPEKPIPLTVVSGYLGAGKTTFINRAISMRGHSGLCVIVNDFGDLSIDAEVLRRADGQTLALANGCVCCSAASGLYTAFDSVLKLSPRPTQILLEASGVADPSRLIAIANAEPDLRPGNVITVVDAATVRADMANMLKAPDILRQLDGADVLLLSKTGIIGQDERDRCEDLLAGLALGVPIVVVETDAALAYLFEVTDDKVRRPPAGWTPPHDPFSRYAARTVRCGALADSNGFLAALEELGPALIRVKGLVSIKNSSDMHLLNGTGGRFGLEAVDLAVPREGSCITAIVARGSGLDVAFEGIVRRHFTAEDIARA